MTDALTPAVTKILWPYLQGEGFTKLTSRKFVREKNGVFQQLWVDANGVAGKKSTYVILCASLPFGPVDGYLDPHGFRISNGRSWNMSNPDIATKSMSTVVEALRASDLPKLDAISNVEKLLSLLAGLPNQSWFSTYSQMHQQWLAKEQSVLRIVDANRAALKL